MNIGLGALYKLQLRLPHPDNLYFLHTPKTAGTTVTEYLRQHFEKELILPFQTWNELYNYLEKCNGDVGDMQTFLNQYRLIAGHFGYGMLRHYNANHIVTILRNPVERTISQLCHIKGVSSSRFFATLVPNLALRF